MNEDISCEENVISNIDIKLEDYISNDELIEIQKLKEDIKSSTILNYNFNKMLSCINIIQKIKIINNYEYSDIIEHFQTIDNNYKLNTRILNEHVISNMYDKSVLYCNELGEYTILSRPRLERSYNNLILNSKEYKLINSIRDSLYFISDCHRVYLNDLQTKEKNLRKSLAKLELTFDNFSLKTETDNKILDFIKNNISSEINTITLKINEITTILKKL